MKVRDLNSGLVNGKMGNLIYYVMNGEQYVRREERSDTLTAATDRHCIGVIYEALPLGPRLAKEVSGCRSDLAGSFRLDNPPKGTKHIYCFFDREDETAFSESMYFKTDDV